MDKYYYYDPLYQSFADLDKQILIRLQKPQESSKKDLTRMNEVYSEYRILRQKLSDLLWNTNNDYFCSDEE